MKAAYITPAITTLHEDGSLDLEAQGKLYDHLIENGVDGILILGSIGEFFAMNEEMRYQLSEFAVQYIDRRVELLVGTGGMRVEDTIALSNHVLRLGADGVVVVSPYYFPMDDAGVEAYYDQVAVQIEGNILLYNFPDRTGYDLSPRATVNLLRKHRNIIGYKDTLAGSDHTRDLIQTIKPEFPGFRIYCGFDDNFARTVLSGGDGCIGGLSNPFPGLCASWVKAFAADDLLAVARIQRTVDQLMEIYRVGMPFVPFIKEAVNLVGVDIRPHVSFPLPQPTKVQSEWIGRIIRESGVLG